MKVEPKTCYVLDTCDPKTSKRRIKINIEFEMPYSEDEFQLNPLYMRLDKIIKMCNKQDTDI